MTPVAARPILQEYDAFTVDELGVNPAEFGKLARHNPVKIVEACWRESDACTREQRSYGEIQDVCCG